MRRYRIRVGLDVDDTLYECNTYALSLLRQKYGDLPELDVNALDRWGEMHNLADERLTMFQDPTFVRSQPVCDGAREFVHALSQIADVFFITAVPPACMSARAERLRRDFPYIPQENILIGTRKDLLRLDVVLDDSATNISQSTASYPVLMRRPWNAHLSGLLSVNVYSDFLRLVEMIGNSFIERAPDLTQGGVICLVGPSGTGKTQIAAELCRNERYRKPVTTTTRPRAVGESQDAYHFIDEAEFFRRRAEGAFIETTVYSKFYFGMSRSRIDEIVEQGKVAVIPVDICGALTLKNLYRDRALLVFTERKKEHIILDIVKRSIDDEDKTRRIMSVDFELRNAELCDMAVNYDDGTAACVTAIDDRVTQKIV